MSGVMEATGDPGGPPTLVGGAIADVVAGLFASWAILAAVHQTQRTGQGQPVDVAMFNTTLSFDEVLVPFNCRLGEEGNGFGTAMKVLDNSRLDVAATSLSLAQAALDAATQWARDRKVGGEPLANRQGIQWMLADMKLRLEASWALTLQATALRTAGRNFTQQSAMAKLHASEMVGFVTDAALQIHWG